MALVYLKCLRIGGGLNLDDGDDVGEGVCQYMSLTDQLRIGVRHVEVDIWWGPLENDIVVCHSPIPLYPIGEVNRQAEAANLTLEWEPAKMSCAGTKRMFQDVLKEIRDWMLLEENLNEILVLYFDTKFYLSPEAVTQSNNEIIDVFGSMLWTYTDGSPLTHTVEELLAAGKRIMIENGREEWLHPSEGDPVVFYPTIWTHQFSANSMEEFPNCTVEGDSSWYGQQQVRALDGTFIEAATRCGVQVASADYINPDDMKLYVWSWDQQEPSSAEGCVAMLPSGRWATLDCATELPFACLRANSEQPAGYGLDWVVNLDEGASGTWDQAKAACSSVQLQFAAPHNGYSNNVLLTKGYGQSMWLNAPNPLKAP